MARALSLLQLLDTVVLELEGLPALSADQMIVMVVPEYVLVMSVLLGEVDGPQQPALYEERERAVDARAGDTDADAAQAEDYVLRLEVIVASEHLRQDHPALRCEPQAGLSQVFVKCQFLVVAHVRSDRWDIWDCPGDY